VRSEFAIITRSPRVKRARARSFVTLYGYVPTRSRDLAFFSIAMSDRSLKALDLDARGARGLGDGHSRDLRLVPSIFSGFRGIPLAELRFANMLPPAFDDSSLVRFRLSLHVEAIFNLVVFDDETRRFRCSWQLNARVLRIQIVEVST